MGRDLKRVALDFDWPLNELWAGFQNPYPYAADCPDCKGSGYSPVAKHLHEQWYGYVAFDPAETGSTPFTVDHPAVRAFAEHHCKQHPEFYGTGEAAIIREAQRMLGFWNSSWSHHLAADDVAALLAKDRLWNFTHYGNPNPTPQQVNEWSLVGMGHDSLNSMYCIQAKCERMGAMYECPRCNGDGEQWPNKATKYLYESWQRVEPPAGDGWQLWENVTEGSPISPVFATSDELVAWMVKDGYSEAGAQAFVKSGYAPSFVMSDAGFQNGVDALGDL